MNYFNYILIISLYLIQFNICDKLIISLTSNPNNLLFAEKVINSILLQSVDKSLYNILLILSKFDFKNNETIPDSLQELSNSKKIEILILEQILNSQSKLLIAIKQYPNNPILIINDNFVYPDGWLEMFLNDHKKYPDEAISASIQFFFGKDLRIKGFEEGYKDKTFGVFNYISDMIFNFALINTNIGGTLYPKDYFKNKLFFDNDLFLKIGNNHDEFWQSAFIIIENKILRQSSIIFDYSKYYINKINLVCKYIKRKKILEKIKNLFLKFFPNFESLVKKRQNKIIVSFTSYPKRFIFIPNLIKYLKKQTLPINNIKLFLSEEDKNHYNLSLNDIDVQIGEYDLRPHLKYFYSMKKYRDYAIITLDDDFGYAEDTFETLFNMYIENPNLVIGRRTHLMLYNKNGELKNYLSWSFEQTKIKDADFNVFITGTGSALYPPDILNINDELLPIIRETITCDDLTLKHFEIQKGIPGKFVPNNMINGMPRNFEKNQGNPLFPINKVQNDICINKLNIEIKNTIVKNLCIPFKKIQTGLTIYLFNIHNIKIKNHRTYFSIYLISYCPLDFKLYFKIIFGNIIAYCVFSPEIDFSLRKRGNKNIAYCSIKGEIKNLNDFLFPKASIKNLHINLIINNYRKYIPIIFNDFNCDNQFNCNLRAIFLIKTKKSQTFEMKINKNNYKCRINETKDYFDYKFPIMKNLTCNIIENKNIKKIEISGLSKKWLPEVKDNIIPNIFYIHRIIVDNYINKNKIVINGKLDENLTSNLSNLTIDFTHPNITLNCFINSTTKFVKAQIYCFNEYNIKIKTEFIIENQIVYSKLNNKSLLLINHEILILKEANLSLIYDEDKFNYNNFSYIYSYSSYLYSTIYESIFPSVIIFILILMIIKIKIVFI